MPGVKQQEIKIIRSIHAFFFSFLFLKNKCVPTDSLFPDVYLEFHSKLQKVRRAEKERESWMYCLALLALYLGTALTHLLKSHSVILL